MTTTSSALGIPAKTFQLTALSFALTLAGCGGGDGNTVDVVQPKPDSGGNTGGNNGGGNNGDTGNGGTTTPVVEPDFFIQKITSDPSNIELGEATQKFTIVVKAVQKATGGAVSNKEVTLSVLDSESNGVTIDGSSTQTTDAQGNATYTLSLNPNAVANTQKLLDNGIQITATAKTKDGSVREQVLIVGVSKSGAEDPLTKSDIKLSNSLKSSNLSSPAVNAYGDTVTVSVQAKQPNGAAAEGVDVILGIADIDGVSIVGGNNKKTDANGMVNFEVKVDPTLTPEQRKDLINSGIAYNIKLTEENGKTTSQAGKWEVANPTSDYNLSIAGNEKPLSVYGAVQNLVVSAKANSNKVPTVIEGATAQVVLNNAPEGVTISPSKVTLDKNGQANVQVTISENLSQTQRDKLVADGISYTVTLTEPNKAVTVTTAKSDVYLPQAAYKVSFDTSTKKQLSSSGGIAEISFRVNDKNGGAVAGQKVVASLPSALKNSSLVTLDSAAEQVTDDKGIVKYTVRVPTGLTEVQKAELEKIKSFVLGVSIKEETGVVTTATSQAIAISSEVGQSDIVLTTQASVDSVNVLGDTFKILVNAVNKNGGAAVDQDVKLVISGVSGVSITGGNSQKTNNNGVAEFTVNLSSSLTSAQREKLIKEGINYLAILTASDGTQSKVSSSVAVAQPKSSITIESVTADAVSELGGSSEVTVRLVSSQDIGKPVANQAIKLTLTNAAKLKGVTVSQDTVTTDVEGKAIFVVNIPSNLTAKDRAELKANGIVYQISYEDKGLTYRSALENITVTAAQVNLSVLNPETVANGQAQYQLSNAGDMAVIKSQLLNTATNKPLNGQSVELVLDNPEVAKLLTVNGQIGTSRINATTDNNGIVSFDVVVPNNLTQQQRDLLKNQLLTATLTENLTGKQKTVGITVKNIESEVILIANALEELNLNGGETQIQVVAKDLNGNVVVGQEVNLALPASIVKQGISLASSPKQVTNNSGVATFTIAAPSNLTSEQKSAIGRLIRVGIATTDSRGNTTSQVVDVNTIQPTSTKEQLTLGANKVVKTTGDTFKVFARISDDNDRGIAGSEVNLSVVDPIKTGVSISGSNKVTTNSDGVAEFNLALTPGANVDKALLEKGIKLKATSISKEGVKLEQDYIVSVDTTTIESYVIMTSAEKTTLNTGGDQTNVTFRIVDNQGGVLSGVPVQLSIDNPQQSGAALTTTSVVTSDAQGLIKAGVVLGAGSVNSRLNHDITVKAKIVTPEYDSSGTSTMTTRAEKPIILHAEGTKLDISVSKTNIQTNDEVVVTTTLIDATGKPIPTANIELVNIDGELASSNATSQTNEQGIATFTIKESDLNFDENGNLRVFAKAIGEQGLVTQRSISSVNLVKASEAGISFGDINGVYDVNQTHNINIQIRDDNPQSLIGKKVEVQTTLGKFTNGQVITTETITADMINGNTITVPVKLTSNLAGTAVLTATVLGQTNSAGQPLTTTVDTRFRATTPAKMLLQAVKSVITPGGSTEIVALIKDANDVPVEGVTVVFSRETDSSAGRLSAATAVTNAQGEARVTYQANAGSPINGVKINAQLLNDSFGIGQKQTMITVSDQAVYTTLAFSDKIAVSPDNIYYIKSGSIAVMDGSGRPMANQKVSLKSYATRFRQGLVCVAERNSTIISKDSVDAEGNPVIGEVRSSSEKIAGIFSSGWFGTEDPQYNYILDKGDDTNGNNTLEPINPVTILGGTLDDDGYTFITDSEGKVDFQIRYPKAYANWTQVRFDATTLLNGSENLQSFNVELPVLVDDIVINEDSIITPYINNASPFGVGDQVCITQLSVVVDQKQDTTSIFGGVAGIENAKPVYVSINNISSPALTITSANPVFSYKFDQAFNEGSVVRVNVGESTTNYVIRVKSAAAQ